MRSGRALIIVGVVIVVGGAIIALVVWGGGGGQSDTQPPQDTPGPGEPTSAPFVPPPSEGMRTIVVAAQDIPRGTRITDSNNAVKTAAWPEEYVPDEAVTDVDLVYGSIARTDIVREMPILEGMISDEAGDLAEVGSDASLMIPQGRVGYSFAVAGNAAVAWAIEPGDHVDVLISILLIDVDEDFQTALPNENAQLQGLIVGTDRGVLLPDGSYIPMWVGEVGRVEELPDGTVVMAVPSESAQRPRMVTQLTVQDAIVLRLGTWAEEEILPDVPVGEEEAVIAPIGQTDSRWLTVAVTPQDAAVLKYAEEMGLSMDLVLRSASDHARALVTTEAVTLQYLFDRFAIELPDRLPYSVEPGAESLRPGASGEYGGGQEEPSRHQEGNYQGAGGTVYTGLEDQGDGGY